MARLSRWERADLEEKKRKDKERVGAVTWGELEALQGAAKKLFNRVLASKSNELTNDDLLTIFVKPKHHEVMKLAPQLIEDCERGTYFTHHLDGIAVEVSYNSPYAQSRDMGKHVFDNEAHEKLRTWLKWRIAVGRKWGLVDATLVELCYQCKDLQTVRFFWPAIVALCSHTAWTAYPRLDPDKMRDFKVPNDLPLLPLGLKTALAETCETVAVSLMLPAEDLEQPVALSVNGGSLRGFITPWGVAKVSY